MKRKLLKRTVLLSPNYPHQSYPHQNYDPLQEPMPILMKYSIFGGLKQLMAAIYSHFDHPIYDQYTVCIYSFFLWHLVLTTQPWCVHINVYKHVYIYIYGIPTSTNIIMSACIDKCIYIYLFIYKYIWYTVDSLHMSTSLITSESLGPEIHNKTLMALTRKVVRGI